MADWGEITAAIGAGLGGEREKGRRELARCWEATGEADHAQRCVIAHYLADLQDELDEEVAWDERALAAFAHLAEGDLAAVGIPSARGLAPSLHLNLGDGYLRQGRVEDARTHLEAGLTAQDVLADDEYGRLIRSGLAGLRQRLDG